MRRQLHTRSRREQLQENNFWPRSRQRATMTETLSSHLSRGLRREKRPRQATRIASEIPSPGITAQEPKTCTTFAPCCWVSEEERILGADGAAGTSSSFPRIAHDQGWGPVKSRKPSPCRVCPGREGRGATYKGRRQECTRTCPLMAEAFSVVRQAVSKHLYYQLSQAKGRDGKSVCSQG